MLTDATALAVRCAYRLSPDTQGKKIQPFTELATKQKQLSQQVALSQVLTRTPMFDFGGPTTDALLFSNSKDFQEYYSSML